MHNTGEGGLSPHHRQGGDIVLQIGTAYFGCRDEDGRFSLDKLMEVVESAPVRAIEIKLSQGAKPGLGGLLPAAKVTKEISEIRGIPMGKDCASPSRHTAFTDEDSLLDFVELVADATGVPVGIKSAVGEMSFWHELTRLMARGDRGVDFVTVDGGEGGTGASPPIFADSIALPFRMGFSRVFGTFAEAGLTDDVTFIGSGKLGLPDNAVVAFALGADMINVAREAMMSIGCIQSQKCHTDRCPTGVATQDPWLAHGLDPASKAVRCAQYVRTFRKELVKVSESIGVAHPGLITADDVDIFSGDYEARSLRAVYGYKEGWGSLGAHLAAGDHRADGAGWLTAGDPLHRGGGGREADRARLAPDDRDHLRPTTGEPAGSAWCGSAGHRRVRRGTPRPSGRRRSPRPSRASPASGGRGPSARRRTPRASGPSCR